jgi:hypothetical protein
MRVCIRYMVSAPACVFFPLFSMHSYMQALQQYCLLGAMHHTHVRTAHTWPQGTQPATNAAGNMFAGKQARFYACMLRLRDHCH